MERFSLFWTLFPFIFIWFPFIWMMGGFLVSCQSETPQAIVEIVNPGFENHLEGWSSEGSLSEIAFSGNASLRHGEGLAETSQVVHGLSDGWYTLKAWMRSNLRHKEAYIALKSCGGETARTPLPLIRDQWMHLVVSAQVKGGQCTISLYSDGDQNAQILFDDVELVPGRAALSIRGADISSLKKSEDKGGLYADENGVLGDALAILRDHGVNFARIRVWVNSPDEYHGKVQLLEMAERLKKHNMGLLVDFHYSDTWADPGKQTKPKAWEALDFTELQQAVYDHTLEICNTLKTQAPPAIVQIGNEITNGMLWPDGKNDRNFKNLAALLKAGYRAVKTCSPSTKIMLHLDQGGKNELYRWWFDAILEQGVDFDVIGISYYPYWHGSLAHLQHNLDDLATRYQKDLIIVETAYPFTDKENDIEPNIIRSQPLPGYRLTPEGQAQMLRDIMNIMRAVPNGRGLGIFWWDATWTAVPGNGWDPANPDSGNGWENQALFDYQNRALPALRVLGTP
ncbi:arabinogalactan endo-1,4-beta-galactosidase [Caldilinea sp.]|uniref:glycoside hydrolase family 53 protein n=1 Tax=Caldilinea sp. TaxID=2293560 RepID=UPI0021DD878C|nr:arabinogalactan endo-1,4-beta-galactosidase [Caldilinea sp.]GIV73485.1 MAG: hypothetical protein KatS3mg049_2041 [Caldilinea sp.]